MRSDLEPEQLLQIALEEARLGLAEGGIPIGAALIDATGAVLARGHNRIVQDGDPTAHAEISAFRSAGRLASYQDATLVTSAAPCWYCSGLIREFQIGRVVIGDGSVVANVMDPSDWLRDNGVEIVLRQSKDCRQILLDYIEENPELWESVLFETGGAEEGRG